MSSPAYNRAYYAARKVELSAAALARYHAEPEAWKAANTAWRKANPEKSKARNRASWHRHRVKRVRESVEAGRKTQRQRLLADRHTVREFGKQKADFRRTSFGG